MPLFVFIFMKGAIFRNEEISVEVRYEFMGGFCSYL